RKIRIDLGIPIEIEDFSIFSRKRETSKYCAIGKIRYSVVDDPADAGQTGQGPKKGESIDGTLIYLKPAIAGNEPKDIYNYAEESLKFPHEPTSDQWFSESQFESYRALGYYIVKTLSRGDDQNGEKIDPITLEQFKAQAEKYLKKEPSDKLD